MEEEYILDEETERQWMAMKRAMEECFNQMFYQPYPNITGEERYCNRTWDDIMCWPDVTAGQIVSQPCPSYISNFNNHAFATRECLPDGNWFFHAEHNRTWTNYTACTAPVARQTSLIEEHMSRLRPLYQVGYSISVAALVAAIFTMASFNKLRCPRNTLHINLFISFVLRAAVYFLRETLVVDGIGLRHDVSLDDTGHVVFRDDISHWECRLLFTVVYMANIANYTWIFVEGLYLHTLIFVAVFSEHSSVKWYIVVGWASPVIIILPWVIVRLTLENVFCWNTHPSPAYLWIIKAPIATTIVVNFLFFLNIVRVLYTKLKANGLPLQARHHRNKRLAKSTLVLIPLFGVPYVAFLVLVDENLGETSLLIKMYLEITFNSFNGLIVACVFCFFNGDVQSEICKRWQRWRTTGKTTSNAGNATCRSVTNVSNEFQLYPGSAWHQQNPETYAATAVNNAADLDISSSLPQRSMSFPTFTQLLQVAERLPATVVDGSLPVVTEKTGSRILSATDRRSICDVVDAVMSTSTPRAVQCDLASSTSPTAALVARRTGAGGTRVSYGVLDHTVGRAASKEGSTGSGLGGTAKTVDDLERRRLLTSQADNGSRRVVTSLVTSLEDSELRTNETAALKNDMR